MSLTEENAAINTNNIYLMHFGGLADALSQDGCDLLVQAKLCNVHWLSAMAIPVILLLTACAS
jgi:hypothetical protein